MPNERLRGRRVGQQGHAVLQAVGGEEPPRPRGGASPRAWRSSRSMLVNTLSLLGRPGHILPGDFIRMGTPIYTRPRRTYEGAPSPPKTGDIHMRSASTQWVEGSSICVEAADIGQRTASYNGRGKIMVRHPGQMGRHGYPLVSPSKTQPPPRPRRARPVRSIGSDRPAPKARNRLILSSFEWPE
jgi:hypothetical protein